MSRFSRRNFAPISITVADAEVDWSWPAAAVDRLIRSVTPSPGAWTESPWGRLVLGPVTPTEIAGLGPGEIRAEKKQVLIGTGTTAVRLGELQPTGRKAMPAADWARGQRPLPGAVLTEAQAPEGARP